MKTLKVLSAGMFLMFAVSSMLPMAYAKPETLALKSDARKQKEVMAKENLKRIQLAKIQDPEVREAIREIVRYLNLQTQQ
jgi:hypothetical protein